MLKCTPQDTSIAYWAEEVKCGNANKPEAISALRGQGVKDAQNSLTTYFNIYSRMVEGKSFFRNARDGVLTALLLQVAASYDRQVFFKALSTAAGVLHWYIEPKSGRRPAMRDNLAQLAEQYGAPEDTLNWLSAPPEIEAKNRRSWMFQCNPRYYDILSCVREQELVTWTVRQHAGEIHRGDRAYIWMSGPNGGIVATGWVITEPQNRKNEPDKYTHNKKAITADLAVDIALDSVMREEPLTRGALKEHEATKSLFILRQPAGTNFPVEKSEEKAIQEMLAARNFMEVPPDEPEIFAQTEKTSVKAKAYTEQNFIDEVFLAEESSHRLLALLKRRKNLVLQGPPGVGKTFAASRLAWLLLGERDESRLCRVQFHQSYSYEDFVMGFRPREQGFALTKGIFFRFCDKARKDMSRPYCLLIDEINRGNLSRIFGELLQLIDPPMRGQAVQLAYNGESFFVPGNLYIIGMMNTADRSLADMDYALRRRFAFYPLAPAFAHPGFAKQLREQGAPEELIAHITACCTALNEEIARDVGPGFRLGHSFFCGYDAAPDWFEDVVQYEIGPLLEEYYFDNPDVVEGKLAVLLEGANG